MQSTPSLAGDAAYFKSLVGAGLDGISQARRESRVFTPPLHAVAWKSMAAGAFAGALGARLARNRKLSGIVLGGVVGTLVGFGAAVAWTSRRFTGSAARSARQSVNAARDEHWLKVHPIDYA
jgi:hypothetical protein